MAWNPLSHLPVPDVISKPLAAYLASRTYLKDHPLKTKAVCGAKWVGVVWGGGPEARESTIKEQNEGQAAEGCFRSVGHWLRSLMTVSRPSVKQQLHETQIPL